MSRCLLTLLVLFASACAARSTHVSGATSRDLSVATEHAFTRLVEVRFAGDAELAGYLVEFAELPLGIRDERPYSPGTVLVRDRQLRNVGFLTPGGHAYGFDADGRTLDRGYGRRDDQVRALLSGNGPPAYRVLSAGRDAR